MLGTSRYTCQRTLRCVAVLATSGIDYDVKLWAPLAPEACFDRERAEEVSL